jgi:hypothetical protein
MKSASRIVKPRTAKQRAWATRYAAKTIAPSLPVEATNRANGSWWIGLNRAELSAAVQRERDRMTLSKFGRLHPDHAV